jgi:hypothetical protein
MHFPANPEEDKVFKGTGSKNVIFGTCFKLIFLRPEQFFLFDHC